MPAHDTLTGEMAGTRGDLLGLVMKTTALTVATVGLYSFWARTRIRRWLWSSLRVAGMPMEYAGRPVEKLMGFVIAAVIVGVYLGLVVMLLVFASLNLMGESWPGLLAAAALVLPVFWLAKYRGQRYLLNHTRWRGIAFSMAPGAWGYVLRAAGWGLGVVLTGMILLPVRTQRLWRFRAERTFYGEDGFTLETPAHALYLAFTPFLVGLYGSVACGVAVWLEQDAAGLGFLVFPPLGLFGWVYWRVVSFRLLASGLRFRGDMALRVAPRTGTVIGIHIVGWLLMGLLFGAIALALVFATGFFTAGAQAQFDIETFQNVSPYVAIASGVLFYLTFFVLRGALRIAMVTFPLFRHVAGTLTVTNGVGVNAVRRGEAAHMADADGFANLFDMGSGI